MATHPKKSTSDPVNYDQVKEWSVKRLVRIANARRTEQRNKIVATEKAGLLAHRFQMEAAKAGSGQPAPQIPADELAAMGGGDPSEDQDDVDDSTSESTEH